MSWDTTEKVSEKWWLPLLSNADDRPFEWCQKPHVPLNCVSWFLPLDVCLVLYGVKDFLYQYRGVWFVRVSNIWPIGLRPVEIPESSSTYNLIHNSCSMEEYAYLVLDLLSETSSVVHFPTEDTPGLPLFPIFLIMLSHFLYRVCPQYIPNWDTK